MCLKMVSLNMLGTSNYYNNKMVSLNMLGTSNYIYIYILEKLRNTNWAPYRSLEILYYKFKILQTSTNYIYITSNI